MTVFCPPKNFALEVAGKLRSRYIARIPVEHTIEQVLDPQYFGRLQGSKQLMVGDVIEVEWEDLSRFGEVQVRAQSPSTSQVILHVRRDFTEEAEVEFADGWGTKWLGGDAHYAITYGDSIREKGFLTKEACAVRIAALDAKQAEVLATRQVAATKAAPKKASAKPATKAKAAA